MTELEKIKHLCRRLGFGYGPSEAKMFAGKTWQQAVDIMLTADQQPDDFPVSQWENCFTDDPKTIQLDPFRSSGLWTLRMACTNQPWHEKLTLFWHNHFAISGNKVEFGPAMTQYLTVLQTHAYGNFGTMMKEVFKTPAMLAWLDTDKSIKAHPNENYAREVMELFTLGVGNYSEKDVQEASRCFTGWTLRYPLYEFVKEKEPDHERIKRLVLEGTPLIAAAYTEMLSDRGEKTILGKKANWTSDQVHDMLAARPETAKRIAKKLWEWYGYADPEPSVIDKIAKTFRNTKGEIRPTLRTLVTMPEFWSEKCVRQQFKHPIEFSIPIIRQLGIGPILASMRDKRATMITPLPKKMRDAADYLGYILMKQGMGPLYPPDVAGWNLGMVWATSATMMERMKFGDALFYLGGEDHFPLAALLGARIKNEYKATDPVGVAQAFAEMFDAPLTAETVPVLTAAVEKYGNVKALDKGDSAAYLFVNLGRLLFSSPTFQYA